MPDSKKEDEKCEMLKYGSFTCGESFDCCDCGDSENGFGACCNYCYSCNACEYCLNEE